MASTALGRLQEHHLPFALAFIVIIYLGFNQLFCVQIVHICQQNIKTNTPTQEE